MINKYIETQIHITNRRGAIPAPEVATTVGRLTLQVDVRSCESPPWCTLVERDEWHLLVTIACVKELRRYKNALETFDTMHISRWGRLRLIPVQQPTINVPFMSTKNHKQSSPKSSILQYVVMMKLLTHNLRFEKLGHVVHSYILQWKSVAEASVRWRVKIGSWVIMKHAEYHRIFRRIHNNVLLQSHT